MHHSLALAACLWLVIMLTLSVDSCAPTAKAPPEPAALLQAVPAADSTKYKRIVDMRTWRNPYLLLRTDGVALLDPADNAEILLKPEEMLGALARLPASAWPYGRVVAVAEAALRNSEQDAVAIRRNKGIVGGILEGAHIAVNWVPSA